MTEVGADRRTSTFQVAAWVALVSFAALLGLVHGPVARAYPNAGLGHRLAHAVSSFTEIPEAFDKAFLALTWKPIAWDDAYDASVLDSEPEPPLNMLDLRGTHRAVAHNRAYLVWLVLVFAFVMQFLTAVFHLLLGRVISAKGAISGFLFGCSFLLLILVGFDLWTVRGSWSALLESYHWWAWPIFPLAPFLSAWCSGF